MPPETCQDDPLIPFSTFNILEKIQVSQLYKPKTMAQSMSQRQEQALNNRLDMT